MSLFTYSSSLIVSFWYLRRIKDLHNHHIALQMKFIFSFLMKCFSYSSSFIIFFFVVSGGYKIAPRACEVSGVQGTCMFVWECLKTEGQVRCLSVCLLVCLIVYLSVRCLSGSV